jgi:transcriptional regulator NrdR family protein
MTRKHGPEKNLRCPVCRGRLLVTDSRTCAGNQQRRTRRCHACGLRVVTIERLVSGKEWVGDGRRRPYADKLTHALDR